MVHLKAVRVVDSDRTFYYMFSKLVLYIQRLLNPHLNWINKRSTKLLDLTWVFLSAWLLTTALQTIAVKNWKMAIHFWLCKAVQKALEDSCEVMSYRLSWCPQSCRNWVLNPASSASRLLFLSWSLSRIIYTRFRTKLAVLLRRIRIQNNEADIKSWS